MLRRSYRSLAKAARLSAALLLTLSTVTATAPQRAWTQGVMGNLGVSESLTGEHPSISLGLPTELPSLTPLDAPTRAAKMGATVEGAKSDFTVYLAPPDLSGVEIPAGISREEAQALAEGLISQRAAWVVDELMRLRAEGLVADFEVRPERFALVIRGAEPEVAQRLMGVPEVSVTAPGADPSAAPPCSPVTLQALADYIHDLSRGIADGEASTFSAASTQSTPPTIYIRPPSGGGSTWSYFYGYAAPTTTVTMRIVRGGNTIASGSTTSAANGYYSFSPVWQGGGCGSGSYSWSLEVGDVVEVTAGSHVVSTVVVPLHAWADPVADIIAGHTLPGRQVEVVLYQPNSTNTSTFSQTVSTGADGSFSVNFGVNFDRRAYARVAVLDGHGKQTFRSINAYRIVVSQDEWGNFSVQGALKPNVGYTLLITRAGSTWVTSAGQTNADSNLSFALSSPLQPGDVVFVAGSGVTMHYVVAGLSEIDANTTTRVVSGKTTPGRMVEVCPKTRTSSTTLSTSCSLYGHPCANVLADNTTGVFSATFTWLGKGNRLDIAVYDAEGNRQTHALSVGAIVAAADNRYISGYWIRPLSTVTITIRRPDASTTVQSQPLEYNTFSFIDISAPTGSVITVTDGALTETMQVQTLTTRVDESTGRLTGVAANGYLVASASDGWSTASACAQSAVNGSYSLTFSNMPLRGLSFIRTWLRGPDGHYTARSLFAFTINASIGTDRVTGYTEQTGTVVTVTLQRGSATLATVTTTTSAPRSFYSVSLGSGTVITTGDKVTVWSSDGDSASVDVPLFTAVFDEVLNRVHGQAPANSRVRVRLTRFGTDPLFGYIRYGTATPANTYTVSFVGQVGTWNNICSEINVAHRCILASASHSNPAGHATLISGPDPAPVGPDAFENDDSVTSAKPYTGVVQIRSFHVPTDTDWVTFTVPAANVGTPYIIATFNEGWGGAACVELRDSWSLLTSDCQIGLGSRVQYVFNSPGTYRLRVYPQSQQYAGHCDASYRLLILPARHRAFVPALMR